MRNLYLFDDSTYLYLVDESNGAFLTQSPIIPDPTATAITPNVVIGGDGSLYAARRLGSPFSGVEWSRIDKLLQGPWTQFRVPGYIELDTTKYTGAQLECVAPMGQSMYALVSYKLPFPDFTTHFELVVMPLVGATSYQRVATLDAAGGKAYLEGPFVRGNDIYFTTRVDTVYVVDVVAKTESVAATAPAGADPTQFGLGNELEAVAVRKDGAFWYWARDTSVTPGRTTVFRTLGGVTTRVSELGASPDQFTGNGGWIDEPYYYFLIFLSSFLDANSNTVYNYSLFRVHMDTLVRSLVGTFTSTPRTNYYIVPGFASTSLLPVPVLNTAPTDQGASFVRPDRPAPIQVS